MTESHLRSIIKGISWRIIGTLDTMMISYFVQFFNLSFTRQTTRKETASGEMFSNAFLIGMIEFVTKIVLYYFHERVWLLYLKERSQTKQISAAKAVTWRIIGSLDTMLWSGVVLKDMEKGVLIGFLEIFTKIILYYFHERLWHRLPIGTVRKWFGIVVQAD